VLNLIFWLVAATGDQRARATTDARSERRAR